MEKCRLSVNTGGCFSHPLGDQTPIDCRYGESIDTVDLPDKQMLCVTGRQRIDWGRIKSPRGVTIHNVSNQGTQVQPTDAEREVMSRRVLYVGFNDATKPALELPPMIPGVNQFGGSQFLWLAPGAEVWLDCPQGATVTVRLSIFPGPKHG